MTEDEMIASGKANFQQVWNGIIPVPEHVAAGSFTELNLKLFHEIWGENGLSQRDKRLAVLGLLAGRGADPAMFGVHVRAALRNHELNAQELRELTRLFVFYAGAPAASAAYVVLEAILRDTDDGRSA